MARVVFTSNLRQHLDCPETEAAGKTVREVLENVFAANQRLRTYVLDDQGVLRKHMNVFIDGAMVKDRRNLSDPVGSGAQLYVMQALSGG